MQTKKILPVILLIVMVIVAIAIRRSDNANISTNNTESKKASGRASGERNLSNRKSRQHTTSDRKENIDVGLDRNTTKLFFTKHAKCRMKCRQITKQEIKEILVKGSINYNKSNLQDPRGATYALEGLTRDRQRVRIIFAPKKDPFNCRNCNRS